jgi:hypothetical protein
VSDLFQITTSKREPKPTKSPKRESLDGATTTHADAETSVGLILQAGGHRFDPGTLHEKKARKTEPFVFKTDTEKCSDRPLVNALVNRRVSKQRGHRPDARLSQRPTAVPALRHSQYVIEPSSLKWATPPSTTPTMWVAPEAPVKRPLPPT